MERNCAFREAMIGHQSLIRTDGSYGYPMQPTSTLPLCQQGHLPDLWLCGDVNAGMLLTPQRISNFVGYFFLLDACSKCRNMVFTNIGIWDIFQGATVK